ncbi:MAG: HAMP domain-containing protein, partial [Bacteroidales bacterium]|nr:HAMP domain-containing protein [Bacteroidales bacterium]
MKLNDLKIGTKMYSGFIMTVLLMLVVGGIAYSGISRIVYQLEISKNVNQIIVEGGDVQSNSLRYIIYGEEKYYSEVESVATNVVIQSEEIKQMLNSEKNKKVAEEIKEAMIAYETANFDYYNLDGIKMGVEAKKREAALNATNQIVGVIDAATLYSRQNKGDYSAVERVYMVQDARNAMNRALITANEYVANPSVELEKELTSELEDIHELLNEAHKLMATSATKKAIEQALVAVTQYEEEFASYIEFVEQQKDIQRAQRESSSLLLSKARDLRQRVYDDVENTQKASYSMLIIILTIAIALSLVLGTLITRNITGPLAKGVRFANAISMGDLTQQLDVKRTDEIGKLAGALKNMSDKIKEVVVEITRGADQITSASQQISSSSQHLSQGASQQAASVEEVSSTMEQIASNVQQNTDNAQQTEKIALLAQEGMRDVSKRSKDTMEANKLIAQKIDIIN